MIRVTPTQPLPNPYLELGTTHPFASLTNITLVFTFSTGLADLRTLVLVLIITTSRKCGWSGYANTTLFAVTNIGFALLSYKILSR